MNDSPAFMVYKNYLMVYLIIMLRGLYTKLHDCTPSPLL